MPTLTGNKHLSTLFPAQGRVFAIFGRKMHGPNPKEVLIPAPTQYLLLKIIDQTFSLIGKFLKLFH